MKEREELEKENSWLAEELKRERRESIRGFDGNKEQKERSSTSDPFFVIDLILFSLLLPFSVGLSDHSLFPVFLLFCFLLPGLLMWEFLLKRFPPSWYFALALILTIVLEIMEIIKLYN
ncbi:MAG: hypothetical protein IKE50_02755 [Erysipelotrichaceae bacterium]|nr:hypothetical protein [Erysipelotrichaceae bacterium]